jgi:CCR4-NOT transcription complex subunit 3
MHHTPHTAELEKLIKKVAEGIELFESFYDKVQTATNPTIKEKNEMELKKEIKKLQRHRDVIKGYIGGNEIKDKKVLLENRKMIEGVRTGLLQFVARQGRRLSCL